ncbi:MAG: DUF3025 domain-containing protein [Deltaproteobacteria bacterium]|nr:DUF3025 domain-containing protein [Deltaproteobacteria bacterium]
MTSTHHAPNSPLITLRNRRPDHRAWQQTIHERSRVFAPYATVAAPLFALSTWPTMDELTVSLRAQCRAAQLEPHAFVRQVSQRGRVRMLSESYDGSIVTRREIPTRDSHWHDLMNALVWIALPQTKCALHTLQYGLLAARAEPDGRMAPGPRTPEHDTVAMLDEGGVMVLCAESLVEPLCRSLAALDRSVLDAALRAESAVMLVLGHGILESTVLAGALPDTHALAWILPVESVSAHQSLRGVDKRLACALTSNEARPTRRARPSVLLQERWLQTLPAHAWAGPS